MADSSDRVILALPDTAAVPWCRLVACGKLNSRNRNALQLVAKPKEFLTLYRAADQQPTFLTALFGEVHGGPKGHFHLDVTTAAFFADLGKSRPRSTCKLQTFHQLLEPIVGKRIDVFVDGNFIVPLNNLRSTSLIRQAVEGTKAGAATIRAFRGTFLVENAPIRVIQWLPSPDRQAVRVTLAASRSTVVFGPTYLTDIARLMEESFRILVLDEVPNVAATPSI